MENIDYYSELQNYALSQFRSNEDFLINLKAISGQFNNLQECINYLLNTLNINNKKGIFLDYTGLLVGTLRDFIDVSNYFKVNSSDVNVSKDIFFETAINTNSSLDDVRYFQRIKAKIGINISNCTRNENISIIKNITFADSVNITKVSPMILDINLIGDNILVTSKLKSDLESILASGVSIRNLTINGV